MHRLKYYIPEAGLALVVIVLLTIQLPWIKQLGMEYDESLFYPNAVKLAFGSDERVEMPNGIYAFSRPLPFMTSSYIGPINSYLCAGFIRLFGTGKELFRYFNFFLLLLFFLNVYSLVDALKGREIAVITVFLLTLDIELWLQSITNQGPFLIQLNATMLAIRFLWRWSKLAKGSDLCLFAACLALGLSEKLTYLWIITILLPAAAWLYPRSARKIVLLRLSAAAGLTFAILIAPILIYLIGNLEMTGNFTRMNVNIPSDFPSVAINRIKNLWILFGGEWSIAHRLGDTIQPSALFSIVGLGFACSIVSVFWIRDLYLNLAIAFTTILVAQNMFFSDGGRLHHLILSYPMPHLCTAILASRLLRSRPLQIAACGIAFAMWIASASRLSAFGTEVSRSDGAPTWSKPIDEIVNWQKQHPNTQLTVACWGIAHQLTALAYEASPNEEFFFPLLGAELDSATSERLSTLLKKRDSSFVFAHWDATQLSVRDKVLAQAALLSLEATTVKSFKSRRTGEVNYSIVSFRPKAELRESSWIQLPHAETGAPIKIPHNTSRLRVDVEVSNFAPTDSLTAKLNGASNLPPVQFMRPCRYFQTNGRYVWEFGPDLYPHGFWPLNSKSIPFESFEFIVSPPGSPAHVKILGFEVQTRLN